LGSLQPPDKLTRYKVLAVTFLILAFTTYAFFLDILIPGLPDSSYRLKVGFDLFLIPCLLLAGGQLMIGGFIIFMTVPTVSRGKNKLRMWQSMALGGYLTFLFSLTYAAYLFTVRCTTPPSSAPVPTPSRSRQSGRLPP